MSGFGSKENQKYYAQGIAYEGIHNDTTPEARHASAREINRICRESGITFEDIGITREDYHALVNGEDISGRYPINSVPPSSNLYTVPYSGATGPYHGGGH